MRIIRTYSELSALQTFIDRYNYLRLGGIVGDVSFGFDRYLNQTLYRSKEWKNVRDKVIVRDGGFDMGMEGWPVGDKILIHHMNPITEEDIVKRNPVIFDPEYLICVSHMTHNAIHYGDSGLLPKPPIERRPNDTCPWK